MGGGRGGRNLHNGEKEVACKGKEKEICMTTKEETFKQIWMVMV